MIRGASYIAGGTFFGHGVMAESQETFLADTYEICVSLRDHALAHKTKQQITASSLQDADKIRNLDARKGPPDEDTPRWAARNTNAALIARLTSELAALRRIPEQSRPRYLTGVPVDGVTTLAEFIKNPGFKILTLEEWWDAMFRSKT
jgi:hypothetical protein